MTQGLLERLAARIASGELQLDSAQHAAAERLAALDRALSQWRPSRGWFPSGLRLGPRAPVPRGLYIHGRVGRGKTMLMDLFYESASFQPRRRVHFHAFMAEVHDRIAAARKSVEGDPIPVVAREIANAAGLICFDEFHVTDIADAMILGRLFTGLFEHRVVVVATSNTPPGELYKRGLNRQLFLPFIDLLQQTMDVIELAAAKDYRLEKLAGQPLYFSPLGLAAQRNMRQAFQRVAGVAAGKRQTLDVKGRTVVVPEAANGVARFSFEELCMRPLGSLDYLCMAQAFHTVLIEDIPILAPAQRNEARRLINLIDTLYDSRICLIASAAGEPHELYTSGDAAELFERTVSRLIEMRSEAYLKARRERAQVPFVPVET
jgi:cell division protein ZapE